MLLSVIGDAQTLNDSIIKLIPYLKNYKMIENKTTLYFCEKYQCKKPLTDINLTNEHIE